jgi:ABC-type uncharacterized transport system auxiliary subunit
MKCALVKSRIGRHFRARPGSRRRHTRTSIAAVVACALLAACSPFTRESPVRQTFLLAAPSPAAVAKPQSGTLRVGSINVAAPFRGKTFVYRVSDLRYENDFYVEFLVPPATMLAEQTARALEQSKPFARIAGPGTSADASWVLEGFASAIYADRREAGKPAAVLDITYYLTPATVDEQVPLWTHEYHERVPMRDASAIAYVEALNTAFGQVVTALSRDLSSAQLPRP